MDERTTQLNTAAGASLSPTPEPLAVDLATAARMVACSQRYLGREISLGRLRAFRIGRTWRVRVSELSAYLGRKEKERHPHPAPRTSGGHFKAKEA